MVKTGGFPGSVTPQQARKLLLSFQEDRTKAMDLHLRGLFKTRQPEILYKELLESSRELLPALQSLFISIFLREIEDPL